MKGFCTKLEQSCSRLALNIKISDAHQCDMSLEVI